MALRGNKVEDSPVTRAVHALDAFSIPALGSTTSAWFDASGISQVRFVKVTGSADVTFDIEGTPDGGTTVYQIANDVVDGTLVDLADQEIRVAAANADAINAEIADCWLVA